MQDDQGELQITAEEKRRIYVSEVYKLLVHEGPSHSLISIEDLIELEL